MRFLIWNIKNLHIRKCKNPKETKVQNLIRINLKSNNMMYFPRISRNLKLNNTMYFPRIKRNIQTRTFMNHLEEWKNNNFLNCKVKKVSITQMFTNINLKNIVARNNTVLRVGESIKNYNLNIIKMISHKAQVISFYHIAISKNC